MTDTIMGILVIGVPALLVGGILLGRYRPVFWMFFAALAVGLGYLTTTGTVDEIGKQAIGYVGKPPAATPAAAPEPATAPEPAPAPAPSAAPEPAPAPEAAPEPAPTPEAAKRGVQLSAFAIFGSAPSSKSSFISGISDARAAIKNGVDPVEVNLPFPEVPRSERALMSA